MRVKLWTSIESGAVTANLEINAFTAQEKVQATKFGALNINFGGAFASPQTQDSPAINFSLEPIHLVIDPVNGSEVSYRRVFRSSAEISEPALAAKVFCDTNLAKLQEAVAQWKSLSDQYTTNYDTTL